MSSAIEESDRSLGPPLHVILAWSYIEWGGAQIYLLSIIRNAPPNWRFTLVVPRETKPDLIRFFEPYGVEFDFADVLMDWSATSSVWSKLTRHARRIRSEWAMYRRLCRYDLNRAVVHIDAPPWQSWILLYLLTRRGNVFVTMHNALSWNPPKWRKIIWSWRINFLMGRRNFHFYSANQNSIDNLKLFTKQRYWGRFTLTRATINPPEIEKVVAGAFDPAQLRAKHDLPADRFLVLCVGQFIDRKGRWIFLEAAKKVLQTNSDIQFVWVGPHAPNAEENRRIEEFRLGENFRFILSRDIGTERADILRFFRLADVFALPSFLEGLPIAILEAQALGIPTISTNVNAIPEAVVNEQTGLLIEAGDADALAGAIEKLNRDPELRAKLASGGRTHVLAHFDERVAARIALEGYAKSLAAESGRAR